MITFTDFCIYTVSTQIVFIVLPWIYRNFLAPFISSIKDFEQFGEWVVITGASDGIGKEFCREFAARGLNIVLIARTKSKLDDVAEKLRDEYKIKTKVIAVDFTKGLEIYDKIEEELRGLDVGVLVNNVGMMYPDYSRFHDLCTKGTFMQDIIACNVMSVPFMTKIVISGMLEKKRGLILNLSSLAAYLPMPIALYSATKAYVEKFTEDLALEYSRKGIEIQTINPGPVSTNMWTVEGGVFDKPSAKVYVKAAMRCIGTGRHIVGYYPHVFMLLFGQIANVLIPYFYKFYMVYSFRKSKLQ